MNCWAWRNRGRKQTSPPRWKKPNAPPRKAASLYERVLACCTDGPLREQALANLVSAYDGLGDSERAAMTAARLPSVWNCREAALGKILRSKPRKQAMRQAIRDFTDQLVMQLADLADADCQFQMDWSPAERVRLIETGITVYDTVYPNDPPRGVLSQLAMHHEKAARVLTADGQRTQALGSPGTNGGTLRSLRVPPRRVAPQPRRRTARPPAGRLLRRPARRGAVSVCADADCNGTLTHHQLLKSHRYHSTLSTVIIPQPRLFV
ncbi:MAG: hypothetical protein LBJ11_10330 [Oscillospiraceae bacterium]|jgi:hypothetical protein|nr:hypothetical protein [Oscillospiraceae bacterium]